METLTPDMVAAGSKAIWDFQSTNDLKRDSEILAEKVYRAMRQAKPYEPLNANIGGIA